MDVDAPLTVLISDVPSLGVKPMVKSEPMDNSADLLLDDELRLQIEKSIELVVEEFSRNTDCLAENLASCDDENLENSSADAGATEIAPVEEHSSNYDSIEHNNNEPTNPPENVPSNMTVSSTCIKNANVVVAELPPKIPNDITVIPINTGSVVNIKSEPRDTTGESDHKRRKFPSHRVSSSNESNAGSSKRGIYLPSLTSGKHRALTILPITSSAAAMKSTIPDGIPLTKPKIRNDSVEFSLTADVTIKTVPSTNTSTSNLPSYKGHSSSSALAALKQMRAGESNVPVSTSGHSIRSNSLPNDPLLGLPMTPSQMYLDNTNMSMKPDTLGSSGSCSSYNSKYCSYKPPPVASTSSMSDLSSCSYSSPSTCASKLCGVPHSLPGPSAQCQQSSGLALMPYSSQPSSFCGNFNSYVQTPPPLSSPKYLKPPINVLNSCRMSSSSPVPAYMRSREPSYSAPILCDSFTGAGTIPPETSSFRSTPPWSTPASSSFRSPTSPATFNFTLPSPNMGPIAPPPPPPPLPAPSQVPSNPTMYPPCPNTSNSLMLPTSHHQKSAQNSSYPFRSNFTPSFTPNSSYQRAQCCFSSQIQCFNSACASSSQQQFSIVQHSTRLSNLKSNSIDSVSSLLQYHTYFKKY